LEKYRAIPAGYMRVGEIAKKAGVTVRTLQYYDKEGLLTPSGASEGGFRLYADKDMVKLLQIIMMKKLNFKLAEIKTHLPALDTPGDVVNTLTNQAAQIRQKIQAMSESLADIEALRDEVAQIETVDFKKYAAILTNLQMKNDNYWLIKHLDDDVFNKLREGMTKEKATWVISEMNRLNDAMMDMQNAGTAPDSPAAQAAAKEYWEIMMDISGGDLDLLVNLSKRMDELGSDRWGGKMAEMHNFMSDAMEIYTKKLYQGEEIFS